MKTITPQDKTESRKIKHWLIANKIDYICNFADILIEAKDADTVKKGLTNSKIKYTIK